MSQILQKLRDVDPSDSDAVKEVITSFFQSLVKHTQENCNIWLRALEDVITRFPRYCSQHRPTIENYLAVFLESSNYHNVIVAAKCAHGLQNIRPSQDKLASPKNCWREQMAILCNSAHTLIEAIFSQTVNIYKTNHSAKNIEPELLAKNTLTKALTNILTVKKSRDYSNGQKNTVLSNKLRNVFVFIQAMLVEVYPVAKPVQPQIILEVIVQALSVSSSVNTDAKEAATVKIQALRTLDAMILCLGPNLIPFSGLVFRFVMQTLKWSSDNPNDESRKVRITAYNSLSRWLGILHVHRITCDGRGRSWEEELTKHIMEDITPVRKIVQLTMSNQYTKNLSKKAKRKLANQTLHQSGIASHMPGEKNKTNVSDETNDEIANAALDCAETFLTVSGIFLKPTTHKTFQERLVRECYNVDSYSVARSLCLLRALDAARKNTGTAVAPPTQYCLQLYSTLVNTSCDEIRKFCSHALLDIRLHLHCSPPSINFALDVQPDTTKTKKNKRKEISKANRAALDFMINAGAITSNAGHDAGEPSTKKPRLVDNISISSGSEESVVMSEEDASDDDILVINDENNDFDADVVEVLPELETSKITKESTETSEDNSPMTVEDSVDITQSPEENTQAEGEDSVDTTDANQNNRKRKLSEPSEEVSIYEAKTQVPLNTSNDTIDSSPVSAEIAYDAPNVENKVVVLEKQDDDDALPSTNETDDVQITCGQVVVSQDTEPAKDTVEVEIEVSAVGTEAADIDEIQATDDIQKNEELKATGEIQENKDIQENEEIQENIEIQENVEIQENEEIQENVEIQENDGIQEKENGNDIAATGNNIEVKITSHELNVEDMMADFVDEVVEEANLIT